MSVVVGSPVQVQATFRALIDNVNTVVDPISISVSVTDSNNNVLISTVPTRQGVGIYTFSWVPSSIGPYVMTFAGVMPDGSTDNIVATFNVEAATGPIISNSQYNLDKDEYLNFMVSPSPMYADPEEIQKYFPEAPLYEVAELVYDASQEAQDIFVDSGAIGPQNQTITPAILTTIEDFVVANVACNLTRIYELGGMNDIIELGLGDLTINTRTNIKVRGINRANASTWCELAGVIRDELYALSSRSGMKAVVKGSKYHNPMPNRRIKVQEWRSITKDPNVIGWRRDFN